MSVAILEPRCVRCTDTVLWAPCPTTIHNPRRDRIAQLTWYLPEEQDNVIDHAHSHKLHATIPMPLLLQSFPTIIPTQGTSADHISLSQTTMEELSEAISTAFNGEITNVEAVGPGDGYHLSFRSADNLQSALRDGITLPGDPTQAIGLLPIDDPKTCVPPFCSFCATYSSHARKTPCTSPYRCLQCGEVGHTESRHDLRAFCPHRNRHQQHHHPEESFCIHCLEEGHRAGTPQCPFWEEASGQDARIRRGIADLYRQEPRFDRSNLTRIPSTIVDLTRERNGCLLDGLKAQSI